MTMPLVFGIADRRGEGNLLLDNLCSNSEPISLRRGDFNLILILVLILGSVQCELYGW